MDLGSFVLESDAKLASSLPPEEAAAYECLRLHVRDICAWAVDGSFTFAAVEAVKAAATKVCPSSTMSAYGSQGVRTGHNCDVLA